MTLIQEMGYVAYRVRDLAGAVDFYRDVCQLEVTEESDDTVFLTGDTRHHWVRLERGDEPGLIRLGYRAVDAAAIDEIERRLAQMGIESKRGDDLRSDFVRNVLRFRAPDGIEFEIYEQMLALPSSPAPDRGISCLLHAVAFVGDVSEARDFYASALGLLVSDQIEEVVVFLRGGNEYHHLLALARGPLERSGTLDHIALLVDGIEDVLQFRAHGELRDALAGDLVKHVASRSVSIYLNDASEGISVEFCNGHGKIADQSYRGRLLRAGPTTVNGWSAGFPARPARRAPVEASPVGPSPSRARSGGTAAASAAALVDAGTN